MNHISSKWLKKLRWLLLLYSSHFIVVYLYLGLNYHEWRGASKFPLEIVFLVGFQAIYEIYSSLKLIRKHTYVAVIITTFIVLFETGIIFNPSGVYYSPYIIPMLAMLFIGGALGWLLPVAQLVTMVAFALFGFAGFIVSPVPITLKFKLTGVAELLIGGILVLIGSKFWRKYYDLSENAELRRLAGRLRRGTQQSTTILNSIGDGVIVFDASGAVDLINPPASAMTGYEIKQALGLDVHKIVKFSSPDPKEATVTLPDYFNLALREKKHITETVKLNMPRTQRNLIVLLSISPIVIPPDNELVGGVAILHDVTKEMEIEQQRSDFISTASHEMRTPLATIEGYLDLALTDKKHVLKEPLRDYIESAHKSTTHLGKLFQDLLSSSRAEDGSLTNNPIVLDMGDFLEQFNDDFRYSTKKYGLGFKFNEQGQPTPTSGTVRQETKRHGAKDKYYVYADPSRLREVVNNLFDNAIKFTEKGEIEVGLSADKDNVTFYMRDTGVGVPVGDLPHLFQKFYRVDNTPTRTIGGTGLGLFICRKIVEMLGGKIWAESIVGKGSTFYISLPRLTDSEVEDLKRAKPVKNYSSVDATSDQTLDDQANTMSEALMSQTIDS